MKTSQSMLNDLLLAERLEPLRAAPGLGPALLFFSGGTALRPLCRKLKLYTHNSVHVITPFDSGGSSAEIRRAFDMLSVGDLRNRLLALADEGNQNNRELYRLFSHRLPKDASTAELRRQLLELASGTHALVSALPPPLRDPITSTLRLIVARLPPDFDLTGANVGNLVLTGIFLSHERDIETALLIASKMLGVLGKVIPASEGSAQLVARLRNGELVKGQHRITGKEVPAIASPVADLFVCAELSSPEPIEVSASELALQQIADADLICFPYGSFYTSVIANLLPRGVGKAIVSARCPKVYVPNWGTDPEQLGMSLADTVERLIAAVRREAPDARTRDIVRRVVLDSANLEYSLQLDVQRVEHLGIEVLDLPFAQKREQELDFTHLAELLVSLS